jgi:hypothetical protein
MTHQEKFPHSIEECQWHIEDELRMAKNATSQGLSIEWERKSIENAALWQSKLDSIRQ